MAQWLSWLERRPVTAKVVGSSPIWVVKGLFNPCGVLAQLGEHLPYKQRVIGSSPIGPIDMDGFPSGQRGQTVNLLAPPSKVRILLHPLANMACADVAQLAEQLICNQQVIGSSPIIGFMEYNSIWMDSRVAKGDRL